MESEENTGTTEVSTVISKRHMQIGEEFLNRVSDMIQNRGFKLKSYAVDDSWGSEDEMLKLEINEKTTLVLTLKRSK